MLRVSSSERQSPRNRAGPEKIQTVTPHLSRYRPSSSVHKVRSVKPRQDPVHIFPVLRTSNFCAAGRIDMKWRKRCVYKKSFNRRYGLWSRLSCRAFCNRLRPFDIRYESASGRYARSDRREERKPKSEWPTKEIYIERYDFNSP